METVQIEKVREHVTIVRLNRPERLNAMSIQLCLDLKGSVDHSQR
ncbi:MAG: enoyl-CoA hydratase/isomerase family protein [Deltaproteobacteria bacterium]|nr:enoyl-CoA hydratase/isomerase family protein [Deltaproteobacteria bacterium]